MKKTYVKPEILFENFSLNTSIASGCEEIIDNQSKGDCGLDFGDIVIFVSQATGCTTNKGVVVEGDDGDYNGLCYHVPQGTNNLFNS